MKHRAFIPSPTDHSELESVARTLEEKLGRTAHQPLAELIGDILIALTSRHPAFSEDAGEEAAGDAMTYTGMWRQILRGRRWKFLGQRIGTRRRQSQKSGDPQKANEMRDQTLTLLGGLLAFRFTHVAFGKGDEPPAAEVEEESTSAAEDHPAESSEAPAEIEEELSDDPNDNADVFAHIAAKYDALARDEKDYAAVVADAYVFVMMELARRAYYVATLPALVARELTLMCLDQRWDQRAYKPRQLRVVTRLGDENQMLPGDYLGIRGVTKKIREDQIPKVLPSEFSMWGMEPNGKLATLDNIVNRSPPCYEHFDTRRPEINHRILLLFVTGLERPTAVATAEEEEGERTTRSAEVIGKAFAFELLVAAALKMPHRLIHADVAWFERREAKWHGWRFPLQVLDVSRLESESWRNVIAVDRVLSHFFVRFIGGLKPHARPEVAVLGGEPSEHLARALRSQNYQAVFLAAVMRARERRTCLPQSSLRLPRFDHETPTVLLACAEDDEEGLRGETFGDLMSAHVAPLPLADANSSELVQQFMSMIVGPLEQKRVLPTI